MRPMYLQRLKLLRSTVKGKMHLPKNTVIDLDLRIKVTQNVAKHPLLHVTYAFEKFDVVTSNGKGDAFTRKYII